MFVRTKKVISILLIAVFALCLFSCGKDDFNYEKYPEDMPFKITDVSEDELYAKHFEYDTVNEVEKAFSNIGKDKYDTVEEFIDYYNKEFLGIYDYSYFFVKPRDRCLLNWREDGFVGEYISAHLPNGNSELLPYLYQNYSFNNNASFSANKTMQLGFMSYPVNANLSKSEKFEFEFKSRRVSGNISRQAIGIAMTCYTYVYINGYLVGHCSAISYSGTVTKYEVANFLFNNYMILSPENIEEK